MAEIKFLRLILHSENGNQMLAVCKNVIHIPHNQKQVNKIHNQKT